MRSLKIRDKYVIGHRDTVDIMLTDSVTGY